MQDRFDDVVNKKMADLQKQIGDLSRLITINKDNLVDAINEIAEVIKPLTKDEIATEEDIDAIIAGTYVKDFEWATKYDVMTESDINAIIAGTYEKEEEGDGDGEIMTESDIEAIIAGTYIKDDEKEDETNMTGREIDEIVEKAFKEENNELV